MLRSLKQTFQKTLALFSLIAIFLQFAAPTAALNAYQSQFSYENGIIVVCRGFELVYLKRDEAGNFVEVEVEEQLPNGQAVNHCDSCFSNLTPQLFIDAKQVAIKIALFRPILGSLNTTAKQLTYKLPIVRAPPFLT